MAKFNAGEIVEPLEYDFTRYGGSAGVIPEPTSKKVDEFNDTMRRYAAEAKKKISDATGGKSLSAIIQMDENSADAEEILDALEGLDSNMLSGQQETLAEALGKLCSGSPDKDQLLRLPFRVFAAFNKWMVAEIRPEKGTPATKA